MSRKVFFLTFSTSHPLQNNWIEVLAPTYDKAREAIFDAFGGKWAFMYTEEDFKPDYFPGGKVGKTLIADEY